ncbi:MAG: serine/threonine protein kinase, partial [Chthonomonadaceae bacterium]|nr:serine/threonine protein kinase [Chthonomonadaceae bacterium]
NPTDPIVRNGLTCMTCHTRGLKAFTDQMREVAVKTPHPDYDKNKCLALYGPKSAMEKLFIEDLKRYADATKETGNEIGDTEPIALLSGEYEAPVNVARASAEVGMKPEEFLKKIQRDPELLARFAVLLADNGAIKRDAWQEGFGVLSHNLVLGTFTGLHTIVASDGNGDFTTIGEAVRNARPGAEIYIRPGVYTEKVVLDKAIELIADGPVGSVTIKGTDSGCIFVSNTKVKIRGIFVRSTVSRGIFIAKGGAEISDCDISSLTLPCVEVNENSTANIQHCVLHNASHGVNLTSESGAIVTDCDIFGCSQEGVAVQPNGGHVLVQNCRVHDNTRSGIWVDGGGRATLCKCDIASSHDTACVDGLGADITIQACKIHDSGHQGIFMEKSHLTMDHSEVYANGFEGVASFTNSIVTVTTSKIRANHFTGFRIFSATVGIDDCDITDNGESGVDKQVRKSLVTTSGDSWYPLV